MNKRKIYDFLRDLSDNNSKEWMDEHRDRYHEAKEIWLNEIQLILDRLAKHDARYASIRPKDTIMRINNNRMFHPDRPVYKDNFGFSPSGKDEPTLYVHVSPKDSFVGGGLHRPDNATLKKIRAAFDYDGDKFRKIIQADSFQDYFGGLAKDPDKLKTSPQGYDQEHEHIELLRHKNLTAIRSLTQTEVISDELVDIVEQAYLELKPFNDYLARAMTVEA